MDRVFYCESHIVGSADALICNKGIQLVLRNLLLHKLVVIVSRW
jgi:hypothetical protein